MLKRVAAAALAVCASSAAAEAALTASTVTAPDGVPLFVEQSSGTAEPGLLLIHGLAQSSYALRPTMESTLCRRIRCVAFDLRGHGQSGKPWTSESYIENKRWADDVAAVIAATNLTKPVMLGWSYGTVVTMDYVRSYGVGGLSGIVMVGASGFVASGNPVPTPQQREDMAKRNAAWAGGDTAAQIEAAKGVVGFYTAKPQDAAWSESAAMLNMQLPAYVRRILNQRRLNNADLAAELTKLPVLLVAGEEDAGVFTAVEPMKKAVPGIQTITYKGIGHSPFVEIRETFEKDLAAFLAKASQR
jgi:pimeloyl-ACP methyl ester carboxylesterase